MKITIASLTKLKENLTDAASKGKPYVFSRPIELASMIDEFIKIRAERDILAQEQEKLLKVMSALQTMAETVQGVIEE